MELEIKGLKLSFDENVKQVRRVSDMLNFFMDKDAAKVLAENENPVVYEVFAKEGSGKGDLSYAVTIINSGSVGGEFFMTKGHFHTADVGEVYLGLEGNGSIVLQSHDGICKKINIIPGEFTYVPKGMAHRSVNTGNTPLKFLAIYDSASGHDYGAIEKNGFKEKICLI